MKLKRLVCLMVGFISLGVGCIGVVLPILPSFPLFLLTVLCFANSSKKLHTWFVGTKLYKKHVEPFLQKKGMTKRMKIMVMLSLTILMGFGFLMMGNVPVGRIVLAIVWAVHVMYFCFGVKTLKEEFLY